jgi:hypothetical protein
VLIYIVSILSYLCIGLFRHKNLLQNSEQTVMSRCRVNTKVQENVLYYSKIRFCVYKMDTLKINCSFLRCNIFYITWKLSIYFNVKLEFPLLMLFNLSSLNSLLKTQQTFFPFLHMKLFSKSYLISIAVIEFRHDLVLNFNEPLMEYQ